MSAVPDTSAPADAAALIEGVALLLEQGRDAEAMVYLEQHFAPACLGMSDADWRLLEETIARYEQVESVLSRPVKATVADRTS